MRAFTLSVANTCGDASNAIYGRQVRVQTSEDLIYAVQFDHCGAVFKNNRRSIDNFLEADCLIMDVDNEHSENPDDWFTTTKLNQRLPNVEFIAVASKSNGKEKKGKSPRPRWHCYFPLYAPVQDAWRIRELKEALRVVVPEFDPKAKDTAHFFYGIPEESLCRWTCQEEGADTICVDEYLAINGIKAPEYPKAQPATSKPKIDTPKACIQLPAYQVDAHIIEAQFLESLRRAGITPRDNLNLVMDGQLHRFAVQGEQGGATSGAYIIHPDGWPNWYVQDFHEGDNMIHFTLDKKDVPFDVRLSIYQQTNTPEQLAEQARRKKEKEQRDLESEQAAIRMARQEYEYPNAEGWEPHPYWTAKHLHPCGHIGISVKVTYHPEQGHICKIGEALIPFYDAKNDEFKGLQRISATPNKEGKFTKRIYKGTHPKGCYFDFMAITRGSNNLFICEGAATAISLFHLNHKLADIIGAITCHNIPDVARAFRKRFPNRRIIIAADNDKNGAGLQAAKIAVAEGCADTILMPPDLGDWNDYLTHKKGTLA